MTTMMNKTRSWSAACFAALLLAGSVSDATAQNFLAVLNEQTSFGDARKSVVFYNSEAIAAGPLFSVFIPDELLGNREDPDAISVDPNTGDVYVIATDNGTPGNDVSANGYFDAEGDWDIFHINFSDVYSHWQTNFEGTDARSLGGALTLGGFAPRTTAESTALELQDYITYGIETPIQSFIPGSSMTDGGWGHSNTFILEGAIEKIGEVNRNPFYSGTARVNVTPTGTFTVSHEILFHVIDADTIIAIDDAIDDDVANDHDYRIIERVNTMPGFADSDGEDGGYNLGTTESWESRRIGKLNLDTDMGVPVNTSDIQAMAFRHDPVSGVRGAWVGERDGGGDDIAFFEFDSSGNPVGYRPFVGGATAFALDDDPFLGNDNLGQIDQIFIDHDTGDLIFVERGLTDTPAHEPGVFRLSITSYDNNGEIELGAWSEKVILDPVKDPESEEGMFYERGYFSAYDSVNDRVIFVQPGDITDSPTTFSADVYILDLTTGLTTSILDVDDSYSLFTGTFNGNYGHKMVAFALPGAGLPGDYNGDDMVDAADYTVWRNYLGTNFDLGGNGDESGASAGIVDEADYDWWRMHYGDGVMGGGGGVASTVPEPASALLLLVALAGLGCGRRR